MKTYVVYSEEYFLSMNTLSTVLRKKVYNVAYDSETAEEIKKMMEEVLQRTVNEAKINANNEMLTAYDIKVICLEGELTIDEAKASVIDDDYTWGKVEKNK